MQNISYATCNCFGFYHKNRRDEVMKPHPYILDLENYSAEIISLLLYEPQALHTLCGIINSPHLLHFTRFGADIFQFALRLSLLAFEDLFFGQIDMITPP